MHASAAQMQEMAADRFVALGRSWIDLASGAPVLLRFAAAGDRASQMRWNERSAELARLRHPLLTGLIDFGFADSARTFEAYSVRPPLRASGPAGSLLLTHAVRFLEARGITLTADVAPFVVRDVQLGGGRASVSRTARRPLGIILQTPGALAALAEIFDDEAERGVVSVNVAGPDGCGLRTLRMLASRVARAAGYVPLSSAVALRLASVHEHVEDRHVCLIVEDHSAAGERRALAAFLARLTTRSARRHVVIRFVRSADSPSNALEVQPMSVRALTSMVFIDRDCGPPDGEILDAARDSRGYPGAFLRRLRAGPFCDHVVRIGCVHESSAAYTLRDTGSARDAGLRAGRQHAIGRALRNAPERAARLASRGRHASAIRLLIRAARVLEGRGERSLAAACAERLAWIERARGRSDRAIESFERARRLSDDAGLGIRAAIGLGVVWTDQQRFAEAEAAIRGACTAAGLLDDGLLNSSAVRALARCLYWQSRCEEASRTLAPVLAADPSCPDHIGAWALMARIQLASGNLRAAVSAATTAVKRAEQTREPGATAAAASSMAQVQLALGDIDRARHWIDGGLRAASSAHLPIAKLRLRALLARAASQGSTTPPDARLAGHLRTALEQRPLPALVRAEIEKACSDRCGVSPAADAAGEDRTLRDLQQFLTAAQGAHDDQTALEELCGTLAERLRAVSVQIVGGSGERRTLARAGRPWQGDAGIVDRVIAGRTALAPGSLADPRVAAEPVRYGPEVIGVLCCRWTPAVAFDPSRASTLLGAAALAAAASVRGLLDRAPIVLPEGACGDLIGASPAAAALREAIARAARAPFPVLVEGESGSGKELVARAIHRLGPRRDRRLCTLNCAALSEELVEAELFGHSRGAFTGAVGERAGLFEDADGGTLFLDEVGELSPRAQAKLLRVLQDGEVRRVGENMPRRVDTRIVAATNRRLDDEVAAARFRADLRFRLDVVRIPVPPLRERSTDVPILAAHFWKDAALRVGSSATMAAETLGALARYDWPGNVRELQNAIASLAVHAPRRGRVVPSMLPAHIARAAAVGGGTFEAARHEFERRYVRAALAQAGGQRMRAARALGVSRQGLAKMLKRLRIDGDPVT